MHKSKISKVVSLVVIMEQKEYIQLITRTDKIRVKFTQHRGKILEFAVNYYALIDGRWRQIMRIDNCHGSSPHKHTFHLHSRQYRVELNSEANIAFTEAKRSILTNYESIRANFLRT